MFKYIKRPSLKLRLALIVILYLIFATAYSIVAPIGRGADEWAHYWYAQFIAQNGRLPASPAEREAAGYKSDWPPLYHLLAAASTSWIETAGPPTFKYRADSIRRQLVPAQGSDAILHTEDELFPWQQEILVWHLGRFLSIGFTLGTLLMTYLIALEVFQGSIVADSRGTEEQWGRRVGENVSFFTSHLLFFPPQTLALVSVAFLAFIPRFLFTGMVFGYDSLTLLLASLFLWLALRVVKGYHHRWSFLALGALAGLALMTKYLAALLPLEIVLLVLYREEVRTRGDEETPHRLTASPSHLSRFTFYVLPLLQAILAFLLVTSGWFGYLLINFNEIDTYGPVLGTLAPLLRGDGSDRTVEQLFAWMSGGQAPPLAHIDQHTYSIWQLLTGFCTTLWGNPIIQPYPLNWFIVVMTGIAIIAAIGLLKVWRTLPSPGTLSSPSNPSPPPPSPRPLRLLSWPVLPRLLARFASPPRLLISLLLLHCLLPVPFMVIRLFGARDTLEAVQGRHLLFLSGPAVVILLVWGLASLPSHASRLTPPVARFTLYALVGLLLVGAMSQLIYMKHFYLSPLPLQTTSLPLGPEVTAIPSTFLEGGTKLIDYWVTPVADQSRFALPTPSAALKISLVWQAGAIPAREDYRLELALVDAQGQTQASWLAYQTQAHYPTRAWEAGDTIRDEGWLPLLGLPAEAYEIHWRLWGENEPTLDWQTLTTYRLATTINPPAASEWLLWRDGAIPSKPPLFRERETAQIIFSQPPTSNPLREPSIPNPYLAGPDGLPRSPASAGPTWANFIIDPDWPPGDYQLVGAKGSPPLLRVAENGRSFQIPPLTYPLEANFENQIKLLGYDLPTRRVQPGQGLPITLYWQGLRWLGEDFVIFSRLLDNQGLAWGGYDRRAKENYSSLLWAPGEIITDGFAVPVAPDTPDGVYTLNLGWYRRVEGQAQSLLLVTPHTGEPTGQTAVTIGPIKVGGPPAGVTVPQANPVNPVNVLLGQQIELLGFNSTLDTQHLKLTLYWQALAQPKTDYTVFVHVRDATGQVVAQKDSPPVGGVYPTGLWDGGEIIKDNLTVPLTGLPPGEYEVVVGLYNYVTGVRLPVEGSPEGAVIITKFSKSTTG